MTLNDLKVQAYDCVVQIETWQLKLQEINKQIQNFKPIDTKEPEKKD